jgi:polyribonucleotide nucleotidyltransferase
MKAEYLESDIFSNDESARVSVDGTESSRSVSQLPTMAEVIVPRAAVGLIIGKGGETIKKLIKETGAKIQFKHDGKSILILNNNNSF